MSAATYKAQPSVANVALWTVVVHVALDTTLPRMTDLATGTLILTRAAPRAETNLVAFAGAVARDHRLGAADQCVSIVVNRTTALSHVINHATACAFPACFSTLARVSALVAHAGLVVGAGVIAAAADVAQSVLANLISRAVIVAVADGLANTAVAPLVAQAISVAPTRGITGSPVTSLTGRAFQFRCAGQERLFAAN